ncbi:hypothetical protein PCANC_15969 [Puccinia coronata f. sp. avenae]|uniref:Alpha N-terminal protein methyltransferase 1 n=1 Tax=Puccinia coronata f. sp. avenae TaxID=200324 RepID=A0A2N5SMJ2_9BASI|nr:hypothetical protein PCANC_15969 [Puccinia coronata f. sp. avenae]
MAFHPAQQNEATRPDLHLGLAYWSSVAEKDTTNNGVLGGFGNGSLPRLDALGSRMFLLTIRPELSTIKPAHQSSELWEAKRGAQMDEQGGKLKRGIYRRALDVGAGIGRVTADVLLYLFDRVDLVEPVGQFIDAGKRNASSGKWPQLTPPPPPKNGDPDNSPSWPPHSKAVRFWNLAIQAFQPSIAIQIRPSPPAFDPYFFPDASSIVGSTDGWNDGCGYDVIWAQWTLGHLSDDELVDFLRTCREALRPAAANSCFTAGAGPAIINSSSSSSHRRSEEQHQQQEKEEDVPTFERDGGLIIVKENIYVSPSDPDGDNFIFDQVDSSVTRSHACFMRIFGLAGLRVIKQDVQRGFDPDLYKVHFYALQ